MPIIRSLRCRRVLNSHVLFTNEFVIELEGGAIGRGAPPQGETVSIYEDRAAPPDGRDLARELARAGAVGRAFEPAEFDAFLEARLALLGRNNAYGLSLAFFNACRALRSAAELLGEPPRAPRAPRLCLNILNGGFHAYTNPVLSDFPEYLLTPRRAGLRETLDAHAQIQAAVRERLRRCERTEAGENAVHRFATRDNRECLDLLAGVLDRLGLAREFELMIDASAGDLRDERGCYRFALTDGSAREGAALEEYWRGLIRDYGLGFLEDPFGETDTACWRRLTAAAGACRIVGDNLYATDAARIAAGAAEGLTHGVIVKPNQAGTVTATRRASAAARAGGQTLMASHRSISTEDTFLSLLTCVCGLPYFKIGPLLTDYSAVLRLNELLRLTEEAE